MTDFNFDGEDLDDLPDYGEGPTFGSADLPEGCVPQSDADDPSDYLTTPRGLPGAPEEPVLREPEDGEKYSYVPTEAECAEPPAPPPSTEPSLRVELAAAAAQWALENGARIHPALRLEERAGRGVCVVTASEETVVQGATLLSVPIALCFKSIDAVADADVARVLEGEAPEPFGALVIFAMKLLRDAETPYLQYLQHLCDETLLKPPPCGRGPFKEALWKGIHAQDAAFNEAAKPKLEGDAIFGPSTATDYACARKLVESRAFQLARRPSDGKIPGLVPLLDFVNYSRDAPTKLVLTDDAVELHSTHPIAADSEVGWDYGDSGTPPLTLLTQYGFLPAPSESARHVVPLKHAALGQLLDGAAFCPVVDNATDSSFRRGRAAALRFAVDLEQTPILRSRREAPSAVVFWVDVDEPFESPLALALRAALASPAEVETRALTVKAWIAPLGDGREDGVRRAILDCAKAVSNDLWKSAPASRVRDRPVMDYQLSQLSRLVARLTAKYDAPAKYPWRS